jgi:hypothetical protein
MYVPQAGGSTIELWLAGWLDGSAPFESVELVTPGADWRGADQTQKKSTKKNIFLYFFFFQSFSSSYTEKKVSFDGHLSHMYKSTCVCVCRDKRAG